MFILWPWPPWHQFTVLSIAYLGLLDLPLMDFLTILHSWMEAPVKSACFPSAPLHTPLPYCLGCTANSRANSALFSWDPNQAPPPLGRPSDPHPTSFHSRCTSSGSPGGLGFCCSLHLRCLVPADPEGRDCLTHLCASSLRNVAALHQTGWTRKLSLWLLQGREGFGPCH